MVAGLDLLQQARRTETSGRVARRLSMLIVFLNQENIFLAAAHLCSCDRRTVSLWYNRIADCTNLDELRKALSDKPRRGRPPKVSRENLEKARMWCLDRAFAPPELADYIEEISKVRLSISQVRYYMRKWGFSTKKTSAVHVNKAPIEDVQTWKRSVAQKVSHYKKLGYAIASLDEGTFLDGVLSVKYWAQKGLRIFMAWSGGHARFSMFCTITDDGRKFFNHTKTMNTASFLEHIDNVYSKVGKMVLFLDKASWHTSKEAKEFFAKRDIIIVWYPTGHSYLNPVENVWNALKSSIDYSIRYADKITHLNAVYAFINKHNFDHDLKKYWNRNPPAGLMRPFVESDGKPDPIVVKSEIANKKQNKKK